MTSDVVGQEVFRMGTGAGASGEGHAKRLPVWAVAVAVCFWGWWTTSLGVAFPLLVLVVAPLLIRRRFAFVEAEFHRAVEVCWVLMLGGVLLAYSQQPPGGVLRGVTLWLPLVIFPAVMAQGWSAGGRVPVSALLPLPGWRRQVDRRSVFDVMPVFVAACLVSASVAAPGRPSFYAGLLGVAGVCLWSVRVHRARAWAAAAVLGFSGLAGWHASAGIGDLQQWVEGRMLAWVARWRGEESGRRMFRTAIGEVGEVGGGSRVVLRIRGYGQGPLPPLLRVSVFTTWNEGSWFAPRSDTEKLELTGDEWRLDRRPGRQGTAFIEWVPDRTDRYLPLPGATRVIAELPATRVERTPVGAVRAELGGGVVGYRVDYGPDAEWEWRPRTEDEMAIPPAEVEALDAVVGDWDLRGRSTADVLDRIEARFQRGFRYTTRLERISVTDPRVRTALGRFLLGSKAGHCEYFATASVLLLRRLGVPARYVTGYSVGAGERVGDLVTVRENALHAWVRVWVDGAWRDFDPTPSTGLEGVRTASTVWARLGWFWDDLRFSVARWWWLGEKRVLRHAYWLAVPLLAGLLWRLRRIREVAEPEGPSPAGVEGWLKRPGLDSEWYGVAGWLGREGWLRRVREPEGRWLGRLGEAGWPPPVLSRLAEAHRLHQRLRFDPAGLETSERSRLREEAGALMGWAARREPLSDGATTAPTPGRPGWGRNAGSNPGSGRRLG